MLAQNKCLGITLENLVWPNTGLIVRALSPNLFCFVLFFESCVSYSDKTQLQYRAISAPA